MTAAVSVSDKAECKACMDAVDAGETQHRRHAEKKCRRIKYGWILFSPESAVWIRRRQVYVSALRFYAGKICTRANLKHKARGYRVPGVLRLPLSVLQERLGRRGPSASTLPSTNTSIAANIWSRVSAPSGGAEMRSQSSAF